VAELQARMSSREFTEWMVYMQHEPSGQARADRRAAILIATLINVNRDPKKSAAVSPQDVLDDFFDFWPEEPVLDEDGNEVWTDEEIAEADARLAALAASMFGATPPVSS
jgi:hypothetical protein